MFFKACVEVLQLNSIKRNSKQGLEYVEYIVQQLIFLSDTGMHEASCTITCTHAFAVKSLMGLERTETSTKQLSGAVAMLVNKDSLEDATQKET